jgi:flagellar biosynthetic protein FlhB
MAEDQESRTEPATPRRREEARQRGQVAFSAEMGAGLVMLAAAGLLLYLGPDMGHSLLDGVKNDLPATFPREIGPNEATTLVMRQFDRWFRLVGPFMGILLVTGLTVNLFQVGVYVAPEKLTWDFVRLLPATGWQRLFSLAALVRGLLAVFKVALLVALCWVLLRDRAGLVFDLSQGGLTAVASHGWSLTGRLFLGTAMGVAILGIVDYAYQRYRFEQSLRMTKQEIKEEHKREEGDPLIKARVRKVQREIARKRMMSAVPKATVVLTNPTHVAVVLLYDRSVMSAPKVVAKGAGHIAERIKQEARRYGVPIMERPPLARAIFRSVNIDQEIPKLLFQAVAEVLAYLYRLRGQNVAT